MNAIAEIIPLASGLAAYQPFRAELAAFKEQNALLHFDYDSKKGNAEARSHVYKLRQSKSAVDKARLAETASIRDLKGRIDDEAKEIIREIEAMIDVHQARLDEVEAQEKARLAAVHDALARFKDTPKLAAFDATPEQIKVLIAKIDATEIDEKFRELVENARAAKEEALEGLNRHYAAAVIRETERAEIERLRKEAADRAEQDRLDAERRAEEEAVARRAEEEAKATKDAEERRVREAEEAAAREVERQRVAAEEAEKRAAQAVEQERARVQREAETKAAEDAKRETNKRHQAKVHGEIAKALVAVGVAEEVAQALIAAIRGGAVPHVTIAY